MEREGGSTNGERNKERAEEKVNSLSDLCGHVSLQYCGLLISREGLEKLGVGGPLGVARASIRGIMKLLDRQGRGYVTKEDLISFVV